MLFPTRFHIGSDRLQFTVFRTTVQKPGPLLSSLPGTLKTTLDGSLGEARWIFVLSFSLARVRDDASRTAGVTVAWTWCYFVCTPSRPDRSK